MSGMGSDLWWMLTLPGVTTELVEQVLALAEQSGLSPRHPDGHLNGFDHEGDRRLLTRDELVDGMVTGKWGTSLWDRAEMDTGLSPRYQRLMLSQDAVYHGESRELITELWVAIAEATGALFGRFEDEWSIEQIWSELTDPLTAGSPPVSALPDWLSWSTYVDVERTEHLPPLPAALGADVRRTPSGASVITLPGEIDAVRFARLHLAYVTG